VIGEGCSLAQRGGPSLLTNGSSSVRGCLGSGVVRIGGIRGSRDDEATGAREVTGGEGWGVFFGNKGISQGRGIRSNEDGVVFLIGGKGISSGVGDLFHGVGIMGVASLCGGDGVSDGGKSIWVGSGVSSISTGGSYCSIDEYSLRCNPHGTRGSGGDVVRGGLGGVGINGGANGNGSTRGGVVDFGITGGNDVVIGIDGGDFGMWMAMGPPPAPEGPGLGRKMGDGDLFLVILL